MIHVMASIAVKPESAAAAQALLVDLAAQSRREAGCIAYELFVQADAPNVFRTSEQWRDAADVDAHMKTAHVAAAIAAAAPLFAAPPEIVRYRKIG